MTITELHQRLEPTENGCVLFNGSLNGRGYAQARIDGRPQRVIAVLVPAPPGYERHHICGNKWCCNPEHIRVLTGSEHRSQHTKTHCVHGHEYTEDNKRWNPTTGRFQCKRCWMDWHNRYRREKRAAAAGQVAYRDPEPPAVGEPPTTTLGTDA